MKIKHISSLCIAACVCLLPQSCDKNDPSIALPGTSVSSAGMNLQVTTNSIIPVRSDAGTPTRVFGNPEDGIIMTEYVSDIVDIMPETKGTIVTASNLPTLTNYGSFQVNAYRAFTKGELNETGDKDNPDNDDDVYDNGTKSASTKAVRDFSLTASYSGGSWTWATPHWRNKSVFSIWSMAPASSANLSPATMTVNGEAVTMPEPDWKNLSSIGPVVDTLTASQIQQIQAKFRSLTFDYTLPAYAPATNSTSIYKDLLFAYNEEMREFEEEDGKLKEDANGYNIIKDGEPTFDVKFYHALAAVKFILNTETTGADIHSVTLCYTDTDGNIVTTNGIATKGTCTASPKEGSVGSCPVEFDWSIDSDTKKPMHFVFNDGTYDATNPDARKVSSGYTNTGDGVLFMIPQTATATGTGLKVIVEFSKYGGTQYYTKVLTSPSTSGLNINWEAGKCYTYTFKIGEFHVPGEKLELENVDLSALNNATPVGRPTTPLNIKGVSKMGLVLDYYQLGSKPDQTVYINAIINGSSLVSYSGDPLTPSTPGSNFDFNFSPIASDPKPNTGGLIYEYGTDSAPEHYNNYYYFDEKSGSKKSKMSEYKPNIPGPFYFVFNTPGDGNKTFQVGFQPSGSDASGGFFASIKCLVVLEVTPDTNIPNNFYTINWAAI